MGTLDHPLMIESVPEIAWILRDKYPRLWALITSLIPHTTMDGEQAHLHGAFAPMITVCHPMRPLPPATFVYNVGLEV
ncbi:hypothetical protein CCUS01_15772 [Colletotrichum cuscutae]|uniref:Uncharacterized protein n=1 Tax=Colletotrichum cuscutae TaxID=1209917 RepID=A0AAI9VGJ8_9PEZI|nr:hypothetical protein CCUS01_15772 [Colletotrichum cuscutae]